MKNFLLTFSLLTLLSSTAHGQYCFGADSYKKENPENETTVKGDVALCYTDEVCAFYTPETGAVAFYILAGSKYSEKDDRGITTYFDNAEDNVVNPRTYFVAITHTTNKAIIVINFTKTGDAIMFESESNVKVAPSVDANMQTAIKTEQDRIAKQKADMVLAQKNADIQHTVDDSLRTAGDTCIVVTTSFGEVQNPIMAFPHIKHYPEFPCTIVVSVDPVFGNADKVTVVSNDSKDIFLVGDIVCLTRNINFSSKADHGTITFKFGERHDSIPNYKPKFLCYKRCDN